MPPSSCTTSAPPSTSTQRGQQVSRPVILSSNIAPRQLNSHVGKKPNKCNKTPRLMPVFFLIFYRIMAPVVHQVPLQVGLQGGHQLRKAIQSGQRDLNHSLHRGRLAHRVVDLPVLIPILDRGLQCIQVSTYWTKIDIRSSQDLKLSHKLSYNRCLRGKCQVESTTIYNLTLLLSEPNKFKSHQRYFQVATMMNL